MTKRKQSLCQNKTGFDYQLNTLRISYFQRKRIHIFIVEYFYTFPNKPDMYITLYPAQQTTGRITL